MMMMMMMMRLFLKPVTHKPETGAIIRRQFLLRLATRCNILQISVSSRPTKCNKNAQQKR